MALKAEIQVLPTGLKEGDLARATAINAKKYLEKNGVYRLLLWRTRGSTIKTRVPACWQTLATRFTTMPAPDCNA